MSIPPVNSNDDQWAAPGGAPESRGFVAPGSDQAPPAVNYQPPTVAGQAAAADALPNATPGSNGPPGYGQPSQDRYYAYSAVQPGVIPLRPLTFSEIYNGIFRVMRNNPKVVFGLTVLLSTIAAVVHSFLEIYVRDAFATELHRLFGSTPDGMMLKDLSVTVVVSPFTIGLVSVILSGVIVIAVNRATIGHRITIGETWRVILPRIPSLIGVSLLTTLITALPMLVAVGALLPFIGSNMSSTQVVGTVIFGLVLLLLVFVSAVFLTIKLMFGAAVAALEALGPVAALKRSWQLTKRGFWRLTGHYVLIYLIVQTLASLLMTPLMILMFLTADFSATEIMVLPAWFAPVTTGITTIITVLFISTLFTLLYTDIRMRREGLDIELMRAAQKHASGSSK